MYFNGTTDYLWVSDYSDFDFGSGNFTIDFWTKIDPSRENAWCNHYEDGNNQMYFYFNTSIGPTFVVADGGTYPVTLNPGNTTGWTTNWTHIAVVRSGNTWTLYVNGTAVDSETYAGTYPNYSGSFTIGRSTGATDLQGNMDEFRISRTARWTSNFTPPTEEHETDENTVLLLHFPGDMSDSKHEITFSDQVRIDVSPTKWSGGFYFDGTDDYLSIPDSDDWNFGSGDFTVEFWIRRGATDIRHTPIYQCDSGGTAASTSFGATIFADNIMHFRICSGSNLYDAVSTGTILSDIWYHIAGVRDGNTLRLFINGTQDGSVDVTGVTANNSTYPLVIGKTGQYDGSQQFRGFMDEIRIVKGEALYTTNFTPPSEPFTIYRVSGDLSDDMRILAIKETDWSIVENKEATGSSYYVSLTTNDPVTIIGRKSDGESSGYGNIIPS
jgi:hypothetical protein